MQLGGGPRHPCAVRLARGQCLRAEPAGLARPAGREPQVSEHDGAAQRVDEVAGGVQAGHRLGERLQSAGHVALRPGGEAEEPGRAAPREMVVRTRQVQARAGRARAVPVASPRACASAARYMAIVDGSVQQVVGLGPRERRACGSAGPRAFRVVEPGLDPDQVARGHQHGAVEETEHRAAPDGVGGQRLQPAVHRRFVPVPSDGGHGQLHQVGRSIEVLGGQGVGDGRARSARGARTTGWRAGAAAVPGPAARRARVPAARRRTGGGSGTTPAGRRGRRRTGWRVRELESISRPSSRPVTASHSGR